MPSKELSPRAWAALVIVYVIWGSTYLAIKYVVRTMPPLLTAGVRFLIAGLILYWLGTRRADRSDRPTRAHWRSAMVIGACLPLGGNGLVNLAEQRPLASGTVALLIATIPLWLALFDRVRFGARLRPVSVAGIAVGFAGAAFLVHPPGGTHIDLVGAMFAIGASMIWAYGSLYARTAPLPSSGAVATGMEMLCGGVGLVIAGAARGELSHVHADRFATSSLIGLAYLIVFGSLVAFTAYVWLLRNVRTTIVGTYAYVNPLVAVFLGALLLHEKLTVTTGIAGAIIIAAVALIVGWGKPEAPLRDDLSAERLAT
ncbi:MAG: EamA family transporter [Actinomycetota bacterium]